MNFFEVNQFVYQITVSIPQTPAVENDAYNTPSAKDIKRLSHQSSISKIEKREVSEPPKRDIHAKRGKHT